MTFDDFSWSNLESNRSLIVHQLITRENEIKHAEGGVKRFVAQYVPGSKSQSTMMHEILAEIAWFVGIFPASSLYG